MWGSGRGTIKPFSRAALMDSRRDGLVKALSRYQKDKKSITWLMDNLGVQSPALASSLLLRHGVVHDELKTERGRGAMKDKIVVYEQLGFTALELVENLQLLAVSDDAILKNYQQIVSAGIPTEKICAPMMAGVAERGSLKGEYRTQFLRFLTKTHPHRTNGEYLADCLNVSLRTIHDAAVSSPMILVDGFITGELLVELRDAGMPVFDILNRYYRISNHQERVADRLDYLRENANADQLTAYMLTSGILQHETFFWSDVALTMRRKDVPSHSVVDPKQLERISEWGALPLKALEHQNDWIMRFFAFTSAIRISESSLALQATGLSGVDVMRFPQLLTFRKDQIKAAAEIVMEHTGRQCLDDSDIPSLYGALSQGRFRPASTRIPNFVYRELAKPLECDSASVQILCREGWMKQALGDFLRERRFTGVEELKDNLLYLKQLGFCARSLLRSLFVMLIPRDSVDSLLADLVVDAKYPLKVAEVEQLKILNLMQYHYEFER